MVAYNFQAKFAGPVEDRLKLTTIRPRRARPTKPGDPLQLYTGMRTKRCRKLLDARCIEVLPITITLVAVELDGAPLSAPALGKLAREDGFWSISEFKDFFSAQYVLPFYGELIRWVPLDGTGEER